MVTEREGKEEGLDAQWACGGSDPLILSGLLVMLPGPQGSREASAGCGGAGAPSMVPGVSPFLKPLPLSARPACPADIAPEAVTAVTFFPMAGFGDHPAGGGGAGSPPVTLPPCSQRPRPCWRCRFSSRLFKPCFSHSGSQEPPSSDLQGPASLAGWALSAEETELFIRQGLLGEPGDGVSSQRTLSITLRIYPEVKESH